MRKRDIIYIFILALLLGWNIGTELSLNYYRDKYHEYQEKVNYILEVKGDMWNGKDFKYWQQQKSITN